MALFRPPIQRTATAVLNRELFSKIIPIAAARVCENKHISRCRAELDKTRELLHLERQSSVRADPDPILASKGIKCLLLKPEVKVDDPTTWSPILQQAVAAKELGVIPYNLHLDYDYWTYLEIMKAILPEDSQDEIPVGFSIVGHVAHLNLRTPYLPYRHLIARVLLDKNPSVKTVINKTDDVGTSSAYRTFEYEVLAGPDDMNVSIREEDCVFRFDYSKVYWNSRLNTEHKRLVDLFKAGEVVCDVMAGVGPFAVPAGKKGVFVWANDLNPDSYESLKGNIVRNKVEPFVRPYKMDGHAFIPFVASELLRMHSIGINRVILPPKNKASRSRTPSTTMTSASTSPVVAQVIALPPTISHFILNLPASAISFLPSLRGIYANHEHLFHPHTSTLLPMVHVHCFSTKSEDNVREGIDICERLSGALSVRMRLPKALGQEGDERDGEGKEKWCDVEIHDVRDVSPQKRMFCASFRLPTEVAFTTAVVDANANVKKEEGRLDLGVDVGATSVAVEKISFSSS